ncbi:MAG: cell division protein FtsA [Candidatus Eremiobacteraeota bacterium]|nr:cell division protein FtsA [Candidatus Eremiobacteraeota bacterium]
MKQGTLCGLDIGTTKTCVVVAAEGPNGLEILGFGEAPSLGMRRGVVIDLEQTVKSIEAATEKAERMSGVHIEEAIVGITGEHVRSVNNRGVVSVANDDREVEAIDVERVVDASKIINVPSDRQIVHALPRFFTVDGQDGILDPVGMAGGRLEVDTHIVTAASSFLSNVLKCVHRAGIESAGIVFEPLASAAATLLPEEQHVGVLLLDIGGGTTDIAVYSGGSALYTATIPVGGQTLTNDISLGLKTSLAQAQEVKHRFGVGDGQGAAARTFPLQSLDGRTQREASTHELNSIVVPRVLETLRMARAKVLENVPRDLVVGEVVLTGGGAQLPGLEAIAEKTFEAPVRIGIPANLGGPIDALAFPQYATAIGLVLFARKSELTGVESARNGSLFTRLRGWLAALWN